MGTLAVNIALYKSLPYDSQKDLEPIGLGGTNPMVLVTKKDLPAKTFPEFQAYVKANQKKVQYGMAGIGAASHLGGLMLNSMMKVDVLEIPYKGTGPALNDLVSGQFDYMVDQAVNVLPQINSGNIKALGVSTTQAPAAAARRADHRRGRPEGLRGHDLERLLRAQGHVEGQHRQDQRRAGQDAGRRKVKVKRLTELAVDLPSKEEATPDALRRAAQGVDRQVGAGGAGRRRQAGVATTIADDRAAPMGGPVFVAAGLVNVSRAAAHVAALRAAGRPAAGREAGPGAWLPLVLPSLLCACEGSPLGSAADDVC